VSNFSIVGFIVVIAIVFLFLKWSSGLQAKEAGTPKETNTKLIWVAVIACLALLGLTVVAGDWK
jgi:hypothetical protein